jgi:hypothetical protein
MKHFLKDGVALIRNHGHTEKAAKEGKKMTAKGARKE